MSFCIPQKFDTVLLELSIRLGKDPQTILVEALEEYVEDQLDLLDARTAHEEWISDGKKSFSFEEVMKICGLDQKDTNTSIPNDLDV